MTASDDSLEALEAAVEQACRDHGYSSLEREAADARLLEAALADARWRGDEYALEVDLGVEWAPLSGPVCVHRHGHTV